MDFILGVLTGIAIGFIWGIWRATQSFIERIMERPEEIRELMTKVEQIHRDADQEIEQLQQTETSNEIRAEFHQGVCYLYDHNDQFLAQGETVTQALTAAEKRYPDMKFSFRIIEPKESTQ
jgi:hypothetical protein